MIQENAYICLHLHSLNIASISYGAFCGWPSAGFLTLQSKTESPFEQGPMTNEQASWVGAILCAGGFVGSLLFSWLAERCGKKVGLLLVAIPSLLSWLLIPFATSINYLLASRFLGGVGGGASFSLVPVYVTEITEDRVRGTIGSFLVLSCNFGILIVFVLGNFLSYKAVPLILATLPVIFLIGVIFLPETPQYLMKSNKHEAAEKSLRYFRNYRRKSKEQNELFKDELEKLKVKKGGTINDSSPLEWNDFNNPIARKAFVIGIALMALNQFCGCFAMLNYTATIFKQSGSSLSPTLSAIIVGFIQLIGSYISTMLVERAGRKLLLATSAIGTGFGLFSLGLYSYLSENGYQLENFNWIPIASFSFAVCVGSMGVLTLPFLVVSEVMPPKIRNIGCMICMEVLWVFAFLVLKYLPLMTLSLGMHGTMFVFACCCLAGAIFVIAFVPETKGKSIEAIMKMLE
ncbi:facilitated trehalose transporter Tret1 isoform X2 [Episyrphus balteatus]|uniref:facilitated trehalose transporter Tret1 isoform X2 n=1 Tax=Episyrphus balteatus TaxID=286459 RepID=UPI002484F0C6|nr:facilitated trehalose transporter Tret1 isoform X2 [Episyrphus balteatus]